jgi:hypothetical protein
VGLGDKANTGDFYILKPLLLSKLNCILPMTVSPAGLVTLGIGSEHQLTPFPL